MRAGYVKTKKGLNSSRYDYVSDVFAPLQQQAVVYTLYSYYHATVWGFKVALQNSVERLKHARTKSHGFASQYEERFSG